MQNYVNTYMGKIEDIINGEHTPSTYKTKKDEILPGPKVTPSLTQQPWYHAQQWYL